MNSRQKRVQQAFLDNEKAVLKKLESNYKDALDEINDRIAILLGRQDADLQHVVYQLEYQKSLKKQVEAILEALHSNEFETVSEYLTKSYDEGFIGTMYDLQGQGIPLVFPIDQEQVVAAIQHETKLSESLYTTLGKDTKKLSKQIAHEISRGISNNATYGEIARNIENLSNIPKNNAARIARTEAHRIQCQATADAQFRAKAKGADVVKLWDATLDGNTRPVHRALDGQIRKLEEPFEAGGYKVMQPGGFGDPSQDCNCRCALLQRARWALGNDFTKWDKESNGIVKIKAEDYDDFKMKYSKESERVRSNVQKINDSIENENERIKKNIDYSIDKQYLSSREYADKFNQITSDSALKREIKKETKDMLSRRSGSNGEDLLLYNTSTKKWYRSTSGTEAGTPEYTDEIKNAIKSAKNGELISFHNHPASMPPSASDINSALSNKYAKGYAFCHDGKIYEYTSGKTYIDESIYNLRIAYFEKNGYNESEAQLLTMQYLSDMYGFEFRELK